MEQDLFNWLNSHGNSKGTGLLVAPLSPGKHDDISAPDENIISETTESPADDTQQGEVFVPDNDIQPEETPAYIPQNDSEIQQEEFTYDDSEYVPEKYIQQHADYTQQEESPVYIPQNDSEIQQGEFTDNDPQSVPDEYVQQQLDDDVLRDHDWQERATGFTLSLDEPPPELWTHINDDDPEPDYEPTESLQGAAYVQIHGRNFTERLHHTLKHRKERAEERAQAENESGKSNPYTQKIIIFCACLLMALGFAFLALWFIGRETPDGMKRRAESFVEAGKFDEAAEIYRKAHRRYPERAEFLAGLSEASQRAGHVQTAKTAHDEYIRLTSHDTRMNEPESPSAKKPPEPERNTPRKPDTAPKSAPVSLILMEKPLTFRDYLNEANHAYNIGMYNRAVINFFRAMEINSSDLRPYIGISSSYRMKGMYFDSYRIIEEARRKFGRSPALDMLSYFLREAK